jgi:hypothetical protein
MNNKKRTWLVRIVALVCVLLLFGSIFLSLILK